MVSFKEASGVHAYRFGQRSADFLICRNCGAYVAAVMSESGNAWGIVNVNCMDDRLPFERPASP